MGTHPGRSHQGEVVSTETLRRAAALMRENAEASRPYDVFDPHVRAWTPAVALAAAVVLTDEADRAEYDATFNGGRVDVEPAVLDFARAYLGES